MKIQSALRMMGRDPAMFAKKVRNRVRDWIIDGDSQRFIRHNKKAWESWGGNKGQGMILFDYFQLAETEIARSYLLNILSRKFDSAIFSFGSGRQSRKWTKIYRSYNVRGHISPRLNAKQKAESRSIFNDTMLSLKTKRNLFDLRVKGIWIGIDIYEEFLMRFMEPTVVMDDPRLAPLVKEGIESLIFWRDFFEQNDVRALVISQVTRMLNIMTKTAGQLFNIPLYTAHARSLGFWPKALEFSHTFRGYREHFQSLSPEEQEKGIEWAKKQIERRLRGEVGVNMSYSTKSAFAVKTDALPVLKKSSRVKVLICPHEFYDSPNCYGGLLFMDFYEWLDFLGNVSQKTDYDWYVKTHPDITPETKRILDKIIKAYPRFEMIPADTSHHQLASEGIDFVLTCYGSVGHEYPLLDIQVINAGDNPHMAYNFNWNPKTLAEYEDLLLNLDSRRKEIDLKELYEFYFVHYGTPVVDDLIFRSYEQMLSDLTEADRIKPVVFSYFMDQLTPERHREILAKFSDFVDSGVRFYKTGKRKTADTIIGQMMPAHQEQ